MALLDRVALVISRLLALIIFPAQLPGDIMGLLDNLSDEPIATIRSWSAKEVWRILRQFFTLQKLTVADDPQLRRLWTLRRRYAARGWSSCTVHTADGFELDAMLLEPPSTAHGPADQFAPPSAASRSMRDDEADAPRFVLFIGGNFQKYEDWLPYFDL